MPDPTLLLVEDDAEFARLAADFLRAQGFATHVEPRGDRAVARIVAERPDMVILDVVLPGLDGLGVCRAARATYRGPILILTARGDERDEILGLEAGADDYLAKPLRPRVLLARVRTLFRRAAPRPMEPLVVGALAIEPSRRTVRLGDADLELTSAEFELLYFLARHAGEVVPRTTILDRLRGLEYDGIDRSIDLRVSRLRQKLARAGAGDAIKTIRGVGYLFAGTST